MAEPAKQRATYADLEAVPPHLVAEIIDGLLITHPRPSPRHSLAANSLADELTSPFQKGRGGPGGWVFATEPELHIADHVLVPDLAAWRRERLAALPATAYFEIAPDWVCEVLSASTVHQDRGRKRVIYGQIGVQHLWLLDPRVQVLEVFTLTGGHWLLVGTWTSDDRVSAPPFDAISFSLADLWPLDRPLGLNEDATPYFAGDR
ncbi:MAG TPA: Uma2 family endonuclease [Mesorhizobium sp.]|nr:Uma2 family endonuclease [Mesorhizobium sp.]